MIFVSFDTSVSQSSGLSQTISRYDNKSRGVRTVKEAPVKTALISAWNVYLYPSIAATGSPLYPAKPRSSGCSLSAVFPLWSGWKTSSSPRRENGRVSTVWTARPTNEMSIWNRYPALSQSGCVSNTQLCAYWLAEWRPPSWNYYSTGRRRAGGMWALSRITSTPAAEQSSRRAFITNN